MRVTAPTSYDVEPASRSRGLPGEAVDPAALAKDAIVAALEDSDLTLMDRVDLLPRGSRDLDEPPSNRRGTVKLDVDVPADEDAVVLMERDGVYSWHLPTEPTTRTKDLEPGPRTVSFEIPVQPRVTRSRAPISDAGTRGLFGRLVQGAAQALVFRFVAPALLEKAIDKMEAHVLTGLVHLTDPDVRTWDPVETLGDLGLRTDRPVRVLLFVHGTFSSTVGGFGALGIGENGPGFLRTAIVGVRRGARLRPQDAEPGPRAERP